MTPYRTKGTMQTERRGSVLTDSFFALAHSGSYPLHGCNGEILYTPERVEFYKDVSECLRKLDKASDRNRRSM